MNNPLNLICNGRDIAIFFDECSGYLFKDCCDINIRFTIKRDMFDVTLFGDMYPRYIPGMMSSSADVSFFTYMPKPITLNEALKISPKTFSELSVLEMFTRIDKKLELRENGRETKHPIPVFVSNGEKLILFTDSYNYLSMESPILANYSIGIDYSSYPKVDLDIKGSGECFCGITDDLDLDLDFILDNKTILDLLNMADEKIRSRDGMERC